jgi:hypothetical protein
MKDPADILNIDINNWNKISGYISKIDFCSDKWNNFFDDKIQIIERIGSDSGYGEVYKLKITDNFFAGKIMPILSEKSIEDNQNEIRIAKIVSKEVEEKRSIYFPLVYGSIKCQNTYFNPKSKFYEEGIRYSLYFWLCENVYKECSSAQKKRIINEHKNQSLNDILNKYENFPKNIFSYVMLSELCFGDLKQFLYYYSKYLSEKSWIKLLYHIFSAIKYLNEKCGILHNDLHTSNILVKLKEKNEKKYYLIPLIHDFGKSELKKSYDLWSLEEKLIDIEKFLYDLSLQFIHCNVPPLIQKKCNDIMSMIYKIKNSRIEITDLFDSIFGLL